LSCKNFKKYPVRKNKEPLHTVIWEKEKYDISTFFRSKSSKISLKIKKSGLNLF